MLSDRLKEETQSRHHALEKLLIPSIKNIQFTEDYVRLLKLFYGFYQPVETAIDSRIDIVNLIDYNERRKAEVIKQDISFIEACEPELLVCKNIPVVQSDAEALGAMYVLEGSTLGGKIISRMITKQLQLDDVEGIRFFTGYGEETEEKWNSFKAYLNNYTQNDGEQNAIISAANETFKKFKDWIEVNEPR